MLIWSLLLTLFVSSSGMPAPEDADTETRSGRLTRYLTRVMEIEPAACPDEAVTDSVTHAYRCARFKGDFGNWKATWEFNLTRHGLPETPISKSPWSTRAGEEGSYLREYGVGGESWTIRFIESDGLVVFSFPWEPPTGEGDSAGKAPARMAGFGGVGVPQLIDASRIRPAYPTQAEEIGITGTVVLEAVVGVDGDVTSIAVLREEPEGLGFADSARSAVSRWRYEPVVVDGRPTAVKLPVYLTIAPSADGS